MNNIGSPGAEHHSSPMRNQIYVYWCKLYLSSKWCYIWFCPSELQSNYPACNEWAVFMQDAAAQSLSSYIMFFLSLCRPNLQLLNMHHILPPPSGRCRWSVWCNRYADLAIYFVPLWRFMFFVNCVGKKLISETSKGIHCEVLNLKSWISF